MNELVGKRVMDKRTRQRGIIKEIKEKRITVDYGIEQFKYLFPAAFAEQLILEDEFMQEKYRKMSDEDNFDKTIIQYRKAIEDEIEYLKRVGGKRYQVIDGKCISIKNDIFLYSFETALELHFPEGTSIKLYYRGRLIQAYISACEEFTIVIQISEFLGNMVEEIEFTAESWILLENLNKRLTEINVEASAIAYELACKGKQQIDKWDVIDRGQDTALKKVSEQDITFIWGPPGTGKTTTLAKIALEFMLRKKRILMLSYSNVSVDGALLRVANMVEQNSGDVVRYGHPRVKEVLERDDLTTYDYVLKNHPELKIEYEALKKEKKNLKKNVIERQVISKRIAAIRAQLQNEEKELIKKALFVATTVSKAIVDKTLYKQKFDLVIFDEASMAYVPQIIFAASMAKERFCCLGDFRQLPAIVQNRENIWLQKDIFEYAGITDAVEAMVGHKWLVMLNIQHRMHPDIAYFVSQNMYANLLTSSEGLLEQRREIADLEPLSSKAMVHIDLSGTYSVCIKTKDGSRINLMSAMFDMLLAEKCSKQYAVAIITPYSAQARLLTAMLRDMWEKNNIFQNITCATVHQFQGSEKPVVVYDAVECFREKYLGKMLTSQENNLADRLFNVAMTRAQGKFILVANKEYFLRRKISKELMFTKCLKKMEQRGATISGENIIEMLGTNENEKPAVFMGESDEEDSWNRYLYDIQNAKNIIFIDIPGQLDDDKEAINDFVNLLLESQEKGCTIYIRTDEAVELPAEMRKYTHIHSYVTTPITIIDEKIIWFGEPLSAANFISEGKVLKTANFPCLRFYGKYTARALKMIFEIPNIKGDQYGQ